MFIHIDTVCVCVCRLLALLKKIDLYIYTRVHVCLYTHICIYACVCVSMCVSVCV